MARGSGKKAAALAEQQKPESKEELTKYIILLSERAKPPVLQKNIEKFAPQIATFILFFKYQVVPILIQISDVIQEAYEKAKPYYYQYQLEDLLPALAGLVMCFFGGEFPLLIVATESFLVTSWKPVKDAVKDLLSEYHHAAVEQAKEEEHKKDEAKDDDGDGVPDVQQISDSEYYQRKFLLAVKVLDPEKCTKALTVCTQAFIVVLGAVKLTFVRALSLGAAIGEMGKRTITKHVTPKLTEICPEDYKKWVPTCVDYTCTIGAVLLAFLMQRVISAFHSAMRGGILCINNLLQYLNKRGIYAFEKGDSNLDEVAGWTLAAIGFLFQFSHGFSLGFPLNLLLFPVTFAEFVLQCIVAIF